MTIKIPPSALPPTNPLLFCRHPPTTDFSWTSQPPTTFISVLLFPNSCVCGWMTILIPQNRFWSPPGMNESMNESSADSAGWLVGRLDGLCALGRGGEWCISISPLASHPPPPSHDAIVELSFSQFCPCRSTVYFVGGGGGRSMVAVSEEHSFAKAHSRNRSVVSFGSFGPNKLFCKRRVTVPGYILIGHPHQSWNEIYLVCGQWVLVGCWNAGGNWANKTPMAGVQMISRGVTQLSAFSVCCIARCWVLLIQLSWFQLRVEGGRFNIARVFKI